MPILSNRLIVGVVLLVVAAYGAVEAYPLLAGPSIELMSPANGAVLDDPVLIAGHAYRTTSLMLDGAPLTPDQNGAFRTTLAFPAGTSILTLSARDRFGRSTRLTRTIVVN